MKRYVDDRGNTPRERAKHVCKKHRRAYCEKRKCKGKVLPTQHKG